jgi:hypothetical protein
MPSSGNDANYAAVSLSRRMACTDNTTVMCGFWSHVQLLAGREIAEDEKAARRLIYESENYILEDGLLWFLYTPRTRKLDRAYTFVKRLCIPTIFRAKIAMGSHDDNLHLGFQRLYATAKLRLASFMPHSVNTKCLFVSLFI